MGHETQASLNVLYEDNHLLAVNKPAMLPTMGVPDDRPSLLSIARNYIAVKYQKPGNVYLGVVSRLDAPVTGVLLMARRSKAAARLNVQFRDRQVRKVYWAIVEGEIEPRQATLRHFLRKDERHRKMHTSGEHADGAREAILEYQVLQVAGEISLVEVRPQTGRKHQIRVQLAKHGYPILGDRKYGSRREFPNGIALHSRLLEIVHPVGNAPLTIEALPPAAWDKFPFAKASQ